MLEVEHDSFKISLSQRERVRRRRILILGSLVTVTVVILSIVLGVTLGTRRQQTVNGDFNLKFFVIGDWGREGAHNQSELGEIMADVAKKFKPAFVISTGDNFYQHGLNSSGDPLFDVSYKNIYSGKGLGGIPWYVVLGNHDYGDRYNQGVDCTGVDLDECQGMCCFSPLWQIGMTYKIQDDRWNCQRLFDMTFEDGQVYILFMDTNPFINSYREYEWATQPYGLNTQCPECQLKEIELRLAMSEATYKIVVGHHPVYSNGHHKNTTELIELLEPILKQYEVLVYLNGHDHDLEHIHFDNDFTHYITSGAGSKVRSFDKGYNFGSQFQHAGQGFISVDINQDDMKLTFYGLNGVLYSTIINRNG